MKGQLGLLVYELYTSGTSRGRLKEGAAALEADCFGSKDGLNWGAAWLYTAISSGLRKMGSITSMPGHLTHCRAHGVSCTRLGSIQAAWVAAGEAPAVHHAMFGPWS